MSLKLRNLGILNVLEAGLVDVVFRKPAAQLLESTAADAEDRERFLDGRVISKILFGVKRGLIGLGGILLVESIGGRLVSND